MGWHNRTCGRRRWRRACEACNHLPACCCNRPATPAFPSRPIVSCLLPLTVLQQNSERTDKSRLSHATGSSSDSQIGWIIMDPESTPLPMAELDYQSDLRLRAADFIPLIAKWCLAVGALAAVELALQLVGMFPIRGWSGTSLHL